MKNSWRLGVLGTTLALLSSACGTDDEPADTQDTQSDVEADVEADGETTPDVDVDTAETSDDVEDTQPDVPATACTSDSECEGEGRCFGGFCHAIPCDGSAYWAECQVAMNAIEPGLGRYAICDVDFCDAGCTLDSECGADEICTDFGHCMPFTGPDSYAPPAGAQTGELMAGFSSVPMNFPVGLSLGGYGERAATNDGRYAVSLRASWGVMHGLEIRAAALDNGGQKMMFIRLPVIFTDMMLHEEVARALQEHTGEDWRHNLVVSSTHTHSGPCNHWHLPLTAALPLGSFGIGEFSQQVYDWMRAETIAAAIAAVDDLQPAKLGWSITEAFDMEDSIGRDRWEQTPPFDDNRLLLIRIDNLEDEPLGVIFSFGAHGTDNGTDYASGDVLDGVERVLATELGEEYGRFIPTMFVNQNSGNMSPAGDRMGHDFPQTMERLGHAFVDKAWGTLMSIETKREITLNGATLRFPINYDLLGYQQGEWQGLTDPPLGGEYHYGGLSCAGQGRADEDYATHYEIDTLFCGGALQFLLHNQPPTTLMRSQITAGEIDGLTFFTEPGELTMEQSWAMLQDVALEHGIDPLQSWTFGYANDHLFYLTPTNLRGPMPPFPGVTLPMAPDDYPDLAISYMQGGYEQTMSMWGPRTGDFLVKRAVEAVGLLFDPAAETEFEVPHPKFFSHRDETPYEIFLTSAEDIGTIVQDVPPVVERLEIVEFAWHGGDPGAEMPQAPIVTLQRLGDDEVTWSSVKLPTTRDYSNFEGQMATRVRPEGDDQWEWVVRWEENGNFPVGRYRFVVSGHYQLSDGPAGRTPYSLMSGEFDLVGSNDLVITPGTVSSTGASFRVGFPADVRADFDNGVTSDPARVSGNLRLRHWMVPPSQNAPISGIEPTVSSWTLRQGETQLGTGDLSTATFAVNAEEAGGRQNVPVSRVGLTFEPALAAGTYQLSLSITDTDGNSGLLETELVVP